MYNPENSEQKKLKILSPSSPLGKDVHFSLWAKFGLQRRLSGVKSELENLGVRLHEKFANFFADQDKKVTQKEGVEELEEIRDVESIEVSLDPSQLIELKGFEESQSRDLEYWKDYLSIANESIRLLEPTKEKSISKKKILFYTKVVEICESKILKEKYLEEINEVGDLVTIDGMKREASRLEDVWKRASKDNSQANLRHIDWDQVHPLLTTLYYDLKDKIKKYEQNLEGEAKPISNRSQMSESVDTQIEVESGPTLLQKYISEINNGFEYADQEGLKVEIDRLSKIRDRAIRDSVLNPTASNDIVQDIDIMLSKLVDLKEGEKVENASAFSGDNSDTGNPEEGKSSPDIVPAYSALSGMSLADNYMSEIIGDSAPLVFLMSAEELEQELGRLSEVLSRVNSVGSLDNDDYVRVINALNERRFYVQSTLSSMNKNNKEARDVEANQVSAQPSFEDSSLEEESKTPETDPTKLQKTLNRFKEINWKERKDIALEKSKKFGLKGLDRYNSLSPKQKIAIGICFAGAGVATGGASTFITKGIAITASSKLFYDGRIQQVKDRNGGSISDKERKIALAQAVAISSFVGIAGPAALQYVGEIADSIGFGSAVESVKENTKTFVDWFKGKAPNITGTSEWSNSNTKPLPNMSAPTDLAPQAPAVFASAPAVGDVPRVVASPPQTGTTTGPVFTPATPPVPGVELTPPAPTPPVLLEYTVKPGNTLGNILYENLNFGNTELSEIQKSNIIANLLNSDSAKDILEKAGITNINKIAEGQVINIEALNAIMSDANMANINGKSLLDRAKDLVASKL